MRILKVCFLVIAVYFMTLLIQMPARANEIEPNMKANLLKAGSTGVFGRTDNQPFIPGTADSEKFRIPALLQLSNGWLMLAADARWGTIQDAGGLDTIVSISKDKGATWEYQFPNYFPDSKGFRLETTTTILDPALIQGTDGTVYLFATANPTGTAQRYSESGGWPGMGSGYITVRGGQRLALTSDLNNVDITPSDEDTDTYPYYVGDFHDNFAAVIDRKTEEPTEYVVDEWYNIYQVSSTNEYVPLTQKQVDNQDIDVQQNIFYHDSVLHVFDTGYLWLSTSTDNGLTWNHQILNSQVKQADEYLIQFSAGKGCVTRDGTLIIGYFKQGQPEFVQDYSQAGFIYSKDNGSTWNRAPEVPDAIKCTSEGEVVELPDGTLRMFLRAHGTNVVTYCDAIWSDEQQNYVWGDIVKTNVMCTSSCNCTAIMYSKPINGKPVILVSYPGGGNDSRTNGKIFTFLLNDDNSMELLNTYQINEGTYMYSSIDELEDGSIGLLWEHSAGGIRYDNFSINAVIPNGEIGQDIELSIPLYKDISTCVLGAVAPDDLQGLDGNIVNVTNIKEEIFTFKGIKSGDTSFTVNDVKYTIHVTEPAPEDISEIEISVGENYVIDVLADNYEQYGDSICANDDAKFSFKGAMAGIADVVINDHIYRFTVVDRIYRVILNANGGNVDQDSFEIKFGELYDKLPIPKYPGHIFAGWHDENGMIIDQKSRHNVLNHVTLKASWISCGMTVNGSWRPMSGQGLTFRVIGDMSQLVKVEVDGIVLTKQDYIVGNDSTLTLNTGFLNKLSAGEHAITVYFADGGIISAKFLTETAVAENSDHTVSDKKPEGKTKVGTKFSDPVSKAIYKVIKAGSSVEYIRNENKKAAFVTIPATIKFGKKTYKVTSVAARAFKNNKKLSTVKIGNNVTTIGASAFYNCPKLKSVTIGKNVIAIGNRAFYKCKKLTKLTIPAKVKKIGKQAFYGCKNLKNVTIKTTKMTKKNVGSKAFSGISSKAKIKVPKKKLTAYKKLLKARGIGKRVKVKN